MIDLLSGAVIFAAGLYLIALGISCFVRPRSTATFLLGHASSGFTHYLELALRVLLGVCLVQRAPSLRYPAVIELFGWVLLITTALLFLIPWRWHQQFALKAVPLALRHIRLLGASSIALGGTLLTFVALGSAG